jgi:tRNA G46 methylase TrmB
MQHDTPDSHHKNMLSEPVIAEQPCHDLQTEINDCQALVPSESHRPRFLQPEDSLAFAVWIATEIPIELEIGSGKGLFLTNAAKANPRHRFVGLELAGKYAKDCQAHVEKQGISNAKFFGCDAVEVMDQDVADSSLTAVHVYFPDPWWKSRHKKRRVLSTTSSVLSGPKAPFISGRTCSTITNPP